MFYKLLGMAVWKAAKIFLTRKVSHASPTKPLVAGGLVVALIGALLLVQSRRGGNGS